MRKRIFSARCARVAVREPAARGLRWLRAAGIFVVFLISASAGAQTVSLSLVGRDGDTVSLPDGYRWLLQEDTTYDVTPGVKDPGSLSFGFHSSYAPVVRKGEQGDPITVPDSTKRYFLSVLPKSGYSLGGAPIAAGQTSVTVTVHQHPIPTAQISVFVFEDNQPINNAPDLPEEQGLAGFKIVLEDAGGRYGISAGVQTMDAFGNPLGTVYDDQGTVVQMGDGVITTDANGEAVVKNLAPAKYGITVVPPTGEGWVQTATIEGKKVIDAWVKANEPAFFVEFGPPGFHVFVGFVKDFKDESFFTGDYTITGQVVNLHNARPPNFGFFPGHPVPGARVGLNSPAGGGGIGIGKFAGPTDEDSSFTITGVPGDTSHELVLWDDNLDYIFARLNVNPPVADAADGTVDNIIELGQIPIFSWFGRLENIVFLDKDGDGFRDPDEPGIPEQAVNIRFRDGSVYQSFPTDLEGTAPFDEVFPFFHWLVAEVDFARYRATGATFIVDNGGPVLPDNGWIYPSRDVLTPQPQFEVDADGNFVLENGQPKELTNPNTGNNLSRTETGEVLTQAFQLFLGQTNVIEWGKRPRAPGENGGISGIVYYATTRAEDDPAMAAAEPWEPGVPRVQVNLYADGDGDGVVDDTNMDGEITLADVDNRPFGWFDGGTKGDEDVDRNDDGTFDWGDAIDITWTDSWDDSLPNGTQPPGSRFTVPGTDPAVTIDGYDGLRNYNQLRPGVFDGGYAFTGFAEGTYIVEAAAPPGYEHVKEEDKNVDFGDPFYCQDSGPTCQPDGVGVPENITEGNLVGPVFQNPPGPTPDLRPPVLVGDLRDGVEAPAIPAELTLFPGVEAPYHGDLTRRMPDRKQVVLKDQLNAAADFFLFTEVPVAGQIVGFVLNDLANEFDPNAPTFGEKFSPPWIPVTVRDWTGTVISKSHTDEYGAYNFLVPSTYTANMPAPSGMSPNMLTVVVNDYTENDFNPKYSQFSYTFQYMPGTTTYLDTPVVPIAAFAGAGQFPVDCNFPDGTPVMKAVSGPDGGPYVSAAGQQITITSAGTVTVDNPRFGGAGEPQTIQRDHGFGTTQGHVFLGGVSLTVNSWNPAGITATVPGTVSTGQLVVIRGDNGLSSELGVTVTVGPIAGTVHHVSPGAGAIQAAVDAASPGDLILVAPGTYDELVILTKPVQLQGSGALSTRINAVQSPAEKILNWRTGVKNRWLAGEFDLLPGQEIGFAGIEPALATVEGAGISVFAKDAPPHDGGFGAEAHARIDGLRVSGASTGGGIFVNGFARHLEISNNYVTGNNGANGGGVIVGHPTLTVETGGGLEYEHGRNEHLRIHHNLISGNGGLAGAGGGISLYTGADQYEVTDNTICGNFSQGDGGGIGHLGRSEGGRISDNRIIFNQSFNPTGPQSGGGIFVGGAAPLVAAGLSPGSGSVEVTGNLIQGNQSGAGDGGGIRLERVNGQDVEASPDDDSQWYTLDVVGNVIANNVAGLYGGGISLQDAVRATILHNTITANDSTATTGDAIQRDPNAAPGADAWISAPGPAGMVSRAHSLELAVTLPPTEPSYSNPVLDSNIIWQNRSFYFEATLQPGSNPPVFDFALVPDLSGETPPPPVFDDLGVIGTVGFLNPTNGVLTGDADPNFVSSYFNADRGQTVLQLEFKTGIQTAAVFDEGGNFIDVRFGPLTLYDDPTSPDGDPGTLFGDYHIQSGSSAINLGTAVADVPVDLDGDSLAAVIADTGADEYVVTTDIAPVAAHDEYSLTVVTAGDVLAVAAPGVLANDYDPDPGDTLEAYLVSDVTDGSLTVALATDGSFTYDPQGFVGTTGFTYRASDGTRSDVASVTITVLAPPPPAGNRPPEPRAEDIAIFVGTGGAQTGTTQVYPNDPDAGDSHTFLITAGPGAGGTTTAEVDMNTGLLTYTPDPDVVGADPLIDQVTVQVTDDGTPALSGEVTVTVTVSRPESQSVIVQIPVDSDGVDTDGDGNAYNDNVYVVLSAGDGFTTMADGRPQYIFSFHDITEPVLAGKSPNPADAFGRVQVPLADIMSHGMLGAEFPASTIRAREGQKVYLNLVNVGMALRPDLFDPHTVHWHGFPNAGSVFDGVPDSSISVNMMANLTYFYNVNIPPGTYMYHCHVEATEHMQMGMLGNLYVEPKQNQTGYGEDPDTVSKLGGNPLATAPQGYAYNDGDGSTAYDVEYPIQIGSFDPEFHDASLFVQPLPFAFMVDKYPMLNGRGYPDTIKPGDAGVPGLQSQPMSSLITATQGQRILLRLSNLAVTRFYTLACSLPMTVVGQDAQHLRSGATGESLYYTTYSLTLGGGTAYDAIIDTAGVAPGTYLLYTTNLQYLSNNDELDTGGMGGMVTEIVIQ